MVAGFAYQILPLSKLTGPLEGICNKITHFVALRAMTTAIRRRRRPRGVNTKRTALQQSSGGKGFDFPEYLDSHEVNALIAAAPNPQARLLKLAQCRVGLRVSETPALETRDLHLYSDRPTFR